MPGYRGREVQRRIPGEGNGGGRDTRVEAEDEEFIDK